MELRTVSKNEKKPVYPGLIQAERSLQAAMAEQKKYADAKSQILTTYNARVHEVARLRGQLQQIIIEAALAGKLNQFESELDEGCLRILALKESIDRLGFAQQSLEREIQVKDKEVTSCLSEVSKLKGYAASYERAKAEYSEVFGRAADFEANRQKFSTGEVPGAARLITLRSQLERESAFLGCGSELRKFLSDLGATA